MLYEGEGNFLKKVSFPLTPIFQKLSNRGIAL
jgi:hypothetical protein